MSQKLIQKDSGREKVARSIAGRLSLRQPQTESLDILHNALEAVPALRDSHARSPDELKAMQAALDGHPEIQAGMKMLEGMLK